WKKIEGDHVDQAHYLKWFRCVIENVKKLLDTGAGIYVWNAHKQFGPMHQILTESAIHVSCVITWSKESFAMGYGDYKQQTEFCLYGWLEEGGAHNWYGATNESTLWNVRREPTKSYLHPTQKPLELAERAIRNSSRADQLVLDPFLGSGTSVI